MVARKGRTYRNVRGETVPLGGDADSVRLIGGMEGVVSTVGAAAQEIRNAAKELHILNTRQFQMFGQHGAAEGGAVTAGTAQRGLVEALREAIDQQTQALVTNLPASIRGEVPPAATGGVPNAPSPNDPLQYPETRPPGPTSGWIPSPASSGPMDDIEGLNGPAGEPSPGAARPNWDEYVRRRDYLGGKGKFNIGNLRQDFGNRMQQTIGNWQQSGPQLVQDWQGEWRYEGEDGADFGDYADEAAVTGFLQRRRIAGAVRGAGQALTEGATFRQAGMNMLPAGAAKLAGGVGAALYAANKIGDFAEQQRAANANWQRMQGGTNFGAVEERFRGQMFQWGQFGVMGGQDAARLYEGVASTGMNRDQRNVAQQFAVDNYKYLGMTVEQSMEIVTTAAETGQESLLGIADALRNVTDSAREAGVNTEVARQQFVDTWQTFSQTLTGPSAVTTAAGFTNAQAGMGRLYQDADFSGVTQENQMRMMAANRGMTYNELLAQTMAPGGQSDFAQMWTQDARTVAEQQLGPQGMAIIAEEVQNRPNPNAPLTEAQTRRLTRRMLEQNPGMDLPTLAQVMQQMTGAKVNQNDVIGYIANMETGTFDPGREARREAQRQQAKGQTKTIELGSSLFDGRRVSGVGAMGTGSGLWSNDYENLEDKIDSANSDWFWKDRDAKGVGSAFLEDVRETKRTGGISEMIATGGSGALSAASKVQVRTAAGPRVVSMEEAMEHFRDQIDRGTAVVAEGAQAGEKIAEAFQVKGDKSVKVESSKNKELGDIGEAANEFKPEGGGGGGRVTISPTPELRRYFQFTGEGVDVSESSGWVPPDKHRRPGTHPTGNPGW